MDICGHIIKTEEIIGIGPLMMRQHPDQNEAILYNSRQLLFDLHLKAHSFEIKSPWFRLGTTEHPDFKKAKEEYAQFKSDYMIAFNDIKKQVEPC